jgi:hypothetical protein
MCMDRRVEWMRLLYMTDICVIFQFKTSVKLKWGCVEPLEYYNFRQLGPNRRK